MATDTFIIVYISSWNSIIMGVDTLFNQPIVIDNGSGMIRMGYSGDDYPLANFSNILGKPKYNKIKYLPSDINENDTFVGNEAQIRRGLLKLSYPIQHGVVEDWNSMELIWQHILTNDLNVNHLKEHPILITEEPLNPKSNRRNMTEVLFESMNVPAIHVALPPLLSLFSTGRTTGVVLDSGDGVTSIVPIYEGFAIPDSINRMNIGGRDITRVLERQLLKEGYVLSSSSEFEIIRNLKERLGKMKLESINTSGSQYSQYFNEQQKHDFKLPDGKIIKVSEQSLFNSTEILFQPHLIGLETRNVSESVYNSIMKTDLDLRAKLFETIVLSGGTTMFKNFGNRTLREIQLIDSQLKLKMYATPERKLSCFSGGSILASLSTFKNLLITKSQYQEDPSCIYDKFT